jgi:Flp pilus assembly protein CpaB
MKHLGLIIAVVLGVVGAAVNFWYLTSKAANFEKVAFLGIHRDASIKRGETFREDHFAAIEIPKTAVSAQLSESALKFADRTTVVGMKATRDYAGGEMVLEDQLRTPPAELVFTDPKERVMWVPVDTRTFVPALVRPGDYVSFLVPKGHIMPAALPPPGENGDGETTPQAPPPLSDTELVGPFKVLSVGNRLGSSDVFKAAGMPQQQENVLSISVRADGNQLDPKAKKLWDLLQAGGFRQAGVILHPRGLEPQ